MSVCMYVYHMSAVLGEPRRECHRTEVAYGYEPPCGYWELSPHP